MKRMIVASEEDIWDPFCGKKYRVDAEGEKAVLTDNPVTAVKAWFKFCNKHPMEAAILTKTRNNGVELLKASQNILDTMFEKYDLCYKPEYIKQGIDDKIADGCSSLVEGRYGDQIYPFCYG